MRLLDTARSAAAVGAVGLVANVTGGLIHVLLVVALVVLIFNLITVSRSMV